jgi:hypothetical protein
MLDDRSKMRDGDMPLLDRIDVALRRVTSGEGQMRVPVEATDPDVVLHDCKREIERLRKELAEVGKDAARYRWLRGDSCMDHSARWTQWEVRRWDAPIWTNDLRRADLDAAIDDAMRKEPDHAR